MIAKIDDIELSIQFSASGFGDSEAYIDTETGAIYYIGDGIDEVVPDDLYENDKYLQLPDKRELGLGKRVAIDFTAEKLPGHLDDVYEIFRRRGAYSKFKGLLDSLGQLDAWHAYEEQVVRNAVIEWCDENNINIESDT